MEDVGPASASGGEPALRVVLVDDHRFFRDGMRRMLETEGIEVAGEAGSGEEALTVVPEAAPDVVLMDLNMPGMSGVEATRALFERMPATPVVVLTASEEGDDLMDSLVAGASGYLVKGASLAEIVAGVRAAAAGESLIAPRMASAMLEDIRSRREREEEAAMIRAQLSERELEVLRMLAQGKDNTEIAQALYLSPSTVKNHISSILTKLHIENRIQAAIQAVRSGLA